MPRPNGVKIPFYVAVAEQAMMEFYSVDLWGMSPEDRSSLIIASLNSEKTDVSNSEIVMETAVQIRWEEIKQDRKLKNKKGR